MGDATVAAALRSPARLVVVEAPGGCGKTFQGASLAADICASLAPGRLLILAHTHGACDVFAQRTRGLGSRLEIRTIDSLVTQVAEAYPDADAPSGTIDDADFDGRARRTARLLEQAPFIVEMLARRYPMVVCDEHQDASADQHAVVAALHRAGARIRAFGDPMQRIYGAGSSTSDGAADDARWVAFRDAADIADDLDVPHRWSGGGEKLGEWILESRRRLMAGGKVRLTGQLPPQLKVVVAENTAIAAMGFQLERDTRRQVDPLLRGDAPLLILSPHNRTVHAIRAFFGRSLPIWEGHTRSDLPPFARQLAVATDAGDVTDACIKFVQAVCTGFSDGQFAKRLRAEVALSCAKATSGKPQQIQNLARLILETPDHRGAAGFLRALHDEVKSKGAFGSVHIDYPHEFWDGVRLGDASDAEAGLAELSRQRAYHSRMPPPRAISTVHKAKGLEAPNVLIMPCDGSTFREKDRRLLYVAISRATRRLTIVVSAANPSPLISI